MKKIINRYHQWQERKQERKLLHELYNLAKEYQQQKLSSEDVRTHIQRKINPSYYNEKIFEKLKRSQDLEELFTYLDKIPFLKKHPLINKNKEKTWSLLGLENKSYEEIHEVNKILRQFGNISSKDAGPLTHLAQINKLNFKSRELEIFLIYMFFIND